MTLPRTPHLAAIALACMLSFTSAHAQKMKTDIPSDILTPDTVETRLGTLKFFDGLPDAETAQKVYDNLDFHRALEVYLNALPEASLYAMREGLRSIGANNQTVPVWENSIDSKALFLTMDPEGVYVTAWLDLRNGPMVIETPPGVRLFVYDSRFYNTLYPDSLATSDDRTPNGKGGRYFVQGPDYKFRISPGYTAYLHSDTFGVWWGLRGIPSNDDPKRILESIKKHLRVYSAVSETKHPPKLKFVNASGLTVNTISANNFRFFEDLNQLVQKESGNAWHPDWLDQLESIGIKQGEPFAPDERMKKILTEAAAVGNATARTMAFRNRDQKIYLYAGKSWHNPDAHWVEWCGPDERVEKYYMVTGETHNGDLRRTFTIDSQRILASFDADKNYFDGARSYQLHLPPKVPAKTSWSVVLYDTQTRSELQTDQQFPSTGSHNPALKQNADGSYDVYFGPVAPSGREGNWVQTLPGKSWFIILRVNGPLEPWFDKTWQPDDVVLMK